MARIDWVKHRLENWALWKEKESRGGLGYATRSVLLHEVVDNSREIDISSTVDDIDAGLTNSAVESLREGRAHLYATLQFIYIGGIGVRETARRMSRAESTIKANLDQADHALSAWFADHAEAKKKRSFTT